MVRQGYSVLAAGIVVFFISAIAHELIGKMMELVSSNSLTSVVSIACHEFTGMAFLGIFFQIFLIQLTAPLKAWRGIGENVGNSIFWISFTMLGQP